MGAMKNLAGQKFGRLTVTNDFYTGSKNTGIKWKCVCDCKNTVIIKSNNLVRGDTKSCGCLNLEKASALQYVHGKTGTRIHGTWKDIIGRCTNKNNSEYENYGGRGITVCERWKKFENFYEDMGEKPEGLQIDRINNNGNYEPGNCRWSTPKENSNNKRNCRFVVFNGETKTIKQWSEYFNIPYERTRLRLNSGLGVENAFGLILCR